MELTAYHTKELPRMRIVPAPKERPWMAGSSGPARCLPLTMASLSGWWILNHEGVWAQWDGGLEPSGIQVLDAFGSPDVAHARSNFGGGILTFFIPYLFRTEPGWSLLARGPANAPKPFIHPLEGIVETDWSIAPFTMNWKFTTPDVPVFFAAGEPICQIAPVRRGDLESFEPRQETFEEPLLGRFSRWTRARLAGHEGGAARLGAPQGAREWRGAYMRGRFPDEPERFEGHQTRLRLKPFAQEGREEG